MVEEIDLKFEGHASPNALAESMSKRFNQMRAAFPESSDTEIFHLILENRYKLLGKTITPSERRKIVDNSYDSLAILTLNTLLHENPKIVPILKESDDDFKSTIIIICETIRREVKNIEDMQPDNCLKNGREVLMSIF